MELPPQVQGVPYAEFDSTGLVFGVTAAMPAGQGHVSSKCREHDALSGVVRYSDANFSKHCAGSTFICTMHAIMEVAPLQK